MIFNHDQNKFLATQLDCLTIQFNQLSLYKLNLINILLTIHGLLYGLINGLTETKVEEDDLTLSLSFLAKSIN